MIKLFNEDCLPALRAMKDNQYSLAIVDPPYGINKGGNKGDPNTGWKKHEYKNWDTRPTKEYFEQIQRVSRNQIIWGANYFSQYLPPSKGWIVWDKDQHGLSMSDCELAYSSFDVSTRIFKCNRIHIRYDGSIHPTQKPVKLYIWLLSRYAKQGDTILDTHLGSGSIAIACHDMGFDLTGFELNTEYFQKAQTKLQNHRKQLQLFHTGGSINE